MSCSQLALLVDSNTSFHSSMLPPATVKFIFSRPNLLTKYRWWVLGDNACEALITAARQASLTAFNMHMRTEEQASIADAAQKRLRERGFEACPTCRSSLALGARDADAPRPIVTGESCHPRGRLCTGAVVESGGG